MTYVYNLLKHFLTYLGSEHLHLIKEQECADVRNFRSNKDCGFKSIQQRTSTAQDVCVCVLLQGESRCSGMAQKCVYVCCCQDPVRSRSRTPESSSKLHTLIHYTAMHNYSTLYYTTIWSSFLHITVFYTTQHYILYNGVHYSFLL